jgi:PKD repeat protein
MKKVIFFLCLMILAVFTYAYPGLNIVTSNFNSIDVGTYSTPTFTDLDGDGLLDLLVGHNYGHIYHYEQNAVNSTLFTPVPGYFNAINVGEYSAPTFTDLDGDGLLDMLIGEGNGNINHYEQYAINSTYFTLVTDNFNSIDVGDRSTPTFTDLDGDGLLDMLIGEADGNINHYEQNVANSISFTLVTENFNSIDVWPYSTPTLSDLDGDGLLDMLIGKADGNINHYEQNAVNSTSFTLITDNFAEVEVLGYSAPTFTDVDGDGFIDLFIGEMRGNIDFYEGIPYIIADFSLSFTSGQFPVGVQFSDISYSNVEGSWNCTWDFDNDGIIDSNEHNPIFYYMLYSSHQVSLTVTNDIVMSTETKLFELPVFSLSDENFAEIDVGWCSAPTFTDLDSDGLLDMLVGEDSGYINHYEQNVVNSTSFSLVTENFNSIDVGTYSAPTFTDLDGDGLLDMLIGEFSGYINHYEQNAINSTSFTYVTNYFNSVIVQAYSTPTFTDLDGDSLLDMLIGEYSGNIYHYEQNAVNSTSFNLVTENFNSINVGSKSVPTFTDLDGDGLLDLLVGEYDGNINHYEQNVEYSNSFTLVTNNFISINLGNKSAPTFTDLDGDGLLDILIGKYYGNINHYEQNDRSYTNFSIDQTSGTIPFDVQFTDKSRLDVTSWQWDFDNDGIIDSYEQNPLYTYTSPGTYSASLTVSGSDSSYIETVEKSNLLTAYIFNEFSLLSPSSSSVDVDVFPCFDWNEAISSRNMMPIYEVYISESPLFTEDLTVIYETQNTYLYPLRDLEVGTTYFWKVKASDHLGNEIWASNGDYWMLSTNYQIEQQFPMIDGLIAEDRTLIRDNSPYWFSSDPHTAIEKDLTIEAGITLRFDDNTRLDIGGNLFVYGTENDSISFLSYSDSSPKWWGIEYQNEYYQRDSLFIDDNYEYISGNIIQFARFSNCQKPLLAYADMYITNCLYDHTYYGITQGDASCIKETILRFPDYYNADEKIGIDRGKVFIDNVIQNTSFSGIHSITSESVFDNNLITDNTGYGINGSSGNYTNNTITNNEGYGINGGSGNYTNNLIIENGQFGIFGGNGDYTDNVVTFNAGYGIDCGPSAVLHNNTVSNNADFGIKDGLFFENNIIDSNGDSNIDYGVFASIGAALSGNTITNNYAYGLQGGALVEDNEISGNGSYGIFADENAIINNNIINSNGDYGILNGDIITNNTLINNSISGGSVYFGADLIKSNTIRDFSNNTIQENTLISTSETGYQFAIINFPECDSLIFAYNVIENNDTDDYCLRIAGSNLTIEHNTISEFNYGGYNYGHDEGVALWINAIGENNSIVDNYIINNSNNNGNFHGGGIYIQDAGLLQVNNNTISGNTRVYGGGGIYQNSGNVEIIHNTITNNATSNNGSAIYLRTVNDVLIEENVITNNSGYYAIYGCPLTFTQNNIYYNYAAGDTILLNLRYTTSAPVTYSNNFWGTSSDQGNIDPSIYDDNENNNTGSVFYQPILTAPSSLTPGQLSVVDTVMVTINGEELLPYTAGAAPGQTVFLCLIGEDGNDFSLDMTEVSIINMTTNFPLHPLMCETGINTGIFRVEITISSTINNPEQNIMQANVGDTLQIISVIDSSKVFYLPIIEMGFNLPETIVFNEDESFLLDLEDYITIPETGEYEIVAEGNENIEISIDSTVVTFLPAANWHGSENILFGINLLAQRFDYEDSLTVYVEAVNDGPVINLPDNISFVEDDSLTVDFSQYISDADNELGELVLSYYTSENILINQNGFLLTFSSQTNWFGVETLTFTIDDQQGRLTGTDDVTIEVLPVNDIPIIELPAEFVFYANQSLTVDFAAYVSDIDGDELSLTASDNINITIEITGLMVTFSVLDEWSGEEAVTFTVSDGITRSTASDVVMIIVTVPPTEPILVLPDNFTFNEDETLIIEFMGYLSDLNVDSLSLSIENNEAITAVISGTEVEFIAMENWFGSVEITVTISGIQERFTASDSVVIIVQPVNDAPEINLPVEFYLDRQGELTIDLADYTFDIDDELLLYTAITGEELEVVISGSLAMISSDIYWVGMENVIFCVDDEQSRLAVCDTVLVIKDFSPFPVIESIIDVPDDQGGKVIVEFTGSCLDTDSLIVRPSEVYQVEYLYNDTWLAANSTIAYGAEIYAVLVTTLQDSMPGNPNIYEFRVIAALEEGNFVSNVLSGYSLDNISPQVPAELLFEGGSLVWSAPVDDDFAYFSIYCNEEFLEYSVEPELNTIGEMGEFRVSAVDCHANESSLSPAISGGYPHGDCNHNLEVEAMDASLVLQYFCLIISDWEEWQITVSDVDGNGSIEAYDAALILQFTVGFINEFPVE